MATHAATSASIRTTPLPSGEPIPVVGQGTWGMAEDPRRRTEEIEALRLGLDLGMTLVDTAEMYADGAAEQLVAEAIGGRRNEMFLVSGASTPIDSTSTVLGERGTWVEPFDGLHRPVAPDVWRKRGKDVICKGTVGLPSRWPG